MARFSKRHYEMVAQAMQDTIKFEALDSQEVSGIWKVARTMADVFARDNGAFKRERFIRACEPGANVRARS